jgi:Domain of unknown function (DUF202)
MILCMKRAVHCLLLQDKRGSITASTREKSTRGAVTTTPPSAAKPNPLSRALFAMFGGNRHSTFDQAGAKKVDAKMFFSAERTFLAWMHAAVLLAGVSIGFGAFTTDGGIQALYSLFFLALAIAFTVYALIQRKNVMGRDFPDIAAARLFQVFGKFTHCLVLFDDVFVCQSCCRCKTITNAGPTVPRPVRRQMGSLGTRIPVCVFSTRSILREFGCLLCVQQVEK